MHIVHFWSDLSMDIKTVKKVLQTFPNMYKEHLNDGVLYVEPLSIEGPL